MYTAIRSYDEEAFDNMSEQSEKKNFIVKRSLQLIPSQGIVVEAKKTWWLQTPATLLKKCLKTPESEVAEDRLVKDMIK